MSSRSKNFRRRPQDPDDEPTNTTTTTTTSSAPKPSSNLKKLSFADDEDQEDDSLTIRPPSSKPQHRTKTSSASRSTKTSSSAHKLTTKDRLTTPSSASPFFLSNVQPQSGEYTKEKLLELQKNTRTLASSRPHHPPASEPIVLLKGMVKPLIKETPKGRNEELSSEEEEGLFRKDRKDAESRLGAMGIGKERDERGDLIPDQAMIAAIRAKRERMRLSKAAAPDYISLDGGSNHGAAEGLSDEEPEFRNRIELIGDIKEGPKRGVFESVEGRGEKVDVRRNVELEVGGEEDEEEEEEEKWVEEQVRKGLGKRIGDGSYIVSNSVTGSNQMVQQQGYSMYTGGSMGYQQVQTVSIGPTIGGAVGVTRSAEVMSISQQAEVASQALQENIKALKESHARAMSSVIRTDENLSASLSNVTSLEMSLSAAGEKFIFMQELRDFVSILCEFLQHKAPYIEELEEQMQKLQEDRAAAVLERRTADDADEMTEIETAVGAAMSVLGKGGSSAAVIAGAAAAAQAASNSLREQSNLPVQLDEFGRDVNKQKRIDMTQRAEARKRRKAKSELRRMSAVRDDNAHRHVEGESSTDESDDECTSYKSRRELLLQTAGQIFSDASEDYSQLLVVKERLETWKKQYLSTYRDAYMSLSVPAIFSPYVRLELLKWDPLYEEVDFNDMQWHSLLFDYGLPDRESEFSLDDADANLVPGLVEKVAVPILHHQIAYCWDTLSTGGTKNAVSATNLVINYVPASSEAIRELLSAIHTRLSDAIANLNVPTWTPLVTKAVPNAARVAAYKFGLSIRLLRNICLWKDILALPVLEQLALDELLGGKVLPHVRSITANVHDAMTRTERIVASLSGVWAGPNATMEHRHKLQPLVDYVLTLGKMLEKKHMSSESETIGLARRLKKMLVDLNEYDKARAIVRTFQLKEAL